MATLYTPVRSNSKHILVEVEAEVCADCGERYFPEGTIDNLIRIKESASKGELPMKEIGKVYRAIA